jgi:hypothetical protein
MAFRSRIHKKDAAGSSETVELSTNNICCHLKPQPQCSGQCEIHIASKLQHLTFGNLAFI